LANRPGWTAVNLRWPSVLVIGPECLHGFDDSGRHSSIRTRAIWRDSTWTAGGGGARRQGLQMRAGRGGGEADESTRLHAGGAERRVHQRKLTLGEEYADKRRAAPRIAG